MDLKVEPVSRPVQKPMGAASGETADITFGYCTEFIVMLDREFGSAQEQEFKDYLTGMGDSIVVVADEDIVKVHVHTNHPGKAIEKGLSYGALTSMKIDNMQEEHEERLNLSRQAEEKEPAPRKGYGICCGFNRKRSQRHIQRTGGRLSDRRRTDHESEHGRYAQCDCSGQCGSCVHPAE